MVELALPKNSRPTKGKTFKEEKGATSVKRFTENRFDP